MSTLTKQQEEIVKQYGKRAADLITDTRPLDVEAAKTAARLIRKLLGDDYEPTWAFVPSPQAAWDYVLKNYPGEFVSPDASKQEMLTAERNFRGLASGPQFSEWVQTVAFILEHTEDGAKIPQDAVEKFKDFREESNQCSWVWYFDKLVILCDRPEYIRLDPEDKSNGEVVRFRDQTAEARYNGILIPNRWLTHTKELDMATLLSCPNGEQRRAIIELAGWKQLLDGVQSEVIDECNDLSFGDGLQNQKVTLFSVTLGREKHKFLRVRCGTGREFVLPCKKTAKTAIKAVADSYQIPVELLELSSGRT